MDYHCDVEPIERSISEEERRTTARVVLAVWGMGCSRCGVQSRHDYRAGEFEFQCQMGMLRGKLIVE